MPEVIAHNKIDSVKEQGRKGVFFRPLFQPKLTINQPNDIYEQEADAMAERVMRKNNSSENNNFFFKPAFTAIQRKCAHCEEEEKKMQRKEANNNVTHADSSIENYIDSLNGKGRLLSKEERSFFEPRFGYDFSRVQLHTNIEANQSAQSINALAYTSGNNIVFNSGQYSPDTANGKRLLGHELTHVVQQKAASVSSPYRFVQKTPTVAIKDERFIGPLSASDRRAARSCPINCCNQTLGTLHAMPLFFHESRGAIVAAGSPRATGIGASLHFIASGTQPPGGDICHCDDFRMIQILQSTHPADPRGNNSFVDNDPAGTSPFYGDVYLHGRAEHAIPGGYTDAGERITTTESIYDRPYRKPAMLGTSSLSWMAETCVSCIKNAAPDIILGCVKYGFTQDYNVRTGSFDPVVAVSPDCLDNPSANFINTLRSDPTTTGYDFRTAPYLVECVT